MGRYHRKKQSSKAVIDTRKEGTNNSSNDDTNYNERQKYKPMTIMFKQFQKNQIEDYLNYYYQSTKVACFSPEEEEEGCAYKSMATFIGGHEFPALTQDILTRPYLELPVTLTSKHRKFVYETCIHVGLFQKAIGSLYDNTRQAIVSIHPDGFDFMKTRQHDVETTIAPISIRQCKPWFYRNDLAPNQKMELSSALALSPCLTTALVSSTSIPTKPPLLSAMTDKNSSKSSNNYSLSRQIVQDETKQAQERIQKLMDHPINCIRTIDITYIMNHKYKSNSPRPLQASKRKMVFVNNTRKMKECILELHQLLYSKQLTEIAFDIEAYNPSKYQQQTCLIQLCTNTGHKYVLDVLSSDSTGNVWDYVSTLLRPIFTNDTVVKIGHGIRGIDIPCLHRDFGLFVVNVFDTYEAANCLNLKGHLGLAKLCRYYGLVGNSCAEEDVVHTTNNTNRSLNVGIDDDRNTKGYGIGRYEKLKAKYQAADWRVRPLTEEMIEYGLCDVNYLIPLRRLLIQDLIGGNGGNGNSCKTISDGHALDVSEGELKNDMTDDNNEEFKDEDGLEQKEEVLQRQGEKFNGDDDDDEGYFTPNDEDNGDESGKDNSSNNEENGKNTEAPSKAASSLLANVSLGKAFSSTPPPLLLKQLEKNGILMNTFKQSQQRCLSLWTPKAEPIGKNSTLVRLIQRADTLTGGTDKKIWTQMDMNLYKELVQWREDVATKEGLMPAMICKLDLLVYMAYKRPGCRIGLRRLSSYDLPELLHEGNEPDYLDDAIAIIFAASSGGSCDDNAGVVEDSVLFADRVISPQQDVDEEEDDAGETKRLLIFSWYLSIIDYSTKNPINVFKWSVISATIAVFWIGILRKTKQH